MKNLYRQILPLAIILTGGMGIGSIHNAQMRDVMPGFLTVPGFLIMLAVIVIFTLGLLIYRYTENLSPLKWRGAAIASFVIAFLEIGNLVSSLQIDGSLAGWLFHEYVGLVAGVLLFVQIILEKFRK